MFHFRPIPFFGAVAALLLTGCYDSRFGEPDDDGEGKPATETIAALRDRYAGTPFTVTGDIVVTGTLFFQRQILQCFHGPHSCP